MSHIAVLCLFLSTHILSLKYLRLPATNKWRATPNVKILVLSHIFGGLRSNAQGSSMARWKARCRFPISGNWTFLASSHDCCTIKRNMSKSAFFDGGGSLWAQISGRWGRRQKSVCGPSGTGMMWLQHCRWKFSHKETLQQTFFDRSWNLLEQIAKSHFVPPFGGLGGNVHGSSMVRWKARGRLPISANWTFSLALTVEALRPNIGRNCAVWKGGGHFERKFQGKGSFTNEFWRQKTRFPELSPGVLCVILRLAILIQYRRVTDTQTDGHAIMAITPQS